MQRRREVLWSGAAAGIALVTGKLVARSPASAATTEPRLAIGGYDTVAYFTDGTPVQGSPEYTTVWHDARWQFASAAHRDLFLSNPDHYAAKYDGHCALGVAVEGGHEDSVDPQAWTIVDDKLYINHTTHWADVWRQNPTENISRADKNWSTVKDQPEPPTTN
jgi:hypothetical protein